ncbi:amidohydrolase family protein [Brevibacterium sp.]|uniref:amidohydrolase n=1 Tax=Brevibacterium sp. TaxID=1701 RepID=UPI002811AE77|nr:amidohydrolase family protein [Brevibacterium sp.]
MIVSRTADLIVRASGMHRMTDEELGASSAQARRAPIAEAHEPSPEADSLRAAVAVSEGEIIGLGDWTDVEALAGPDTEVVALQGTIVPAFTDAHAHPIMSLSLARGAALKECATLDEVAEALRAEAAERGADEWVLGWGLDPNVFVDGAITNDVLHEALGPDRLAYVTLFDAHSAIASDAALAIAGITGPRAYPGHSFVVADDAGKPTGHLLEMGAMNEVQAHIPEQALEERVAGLRELLSAMAAKGIAEIHVMDMNDPETVALLTAAEEEAPLPVKLRISPWCTPTMDAADCAELVEKQRLHGRRWRVGGVKFFIDGTVEGGTAWLETPDSRGEGTTSAWEGIDAYAARVSQLNSAGVPTATHAIGERGIREVAETLAALPDTGVQHRIEHIESVGRDVIDLLGRAGIAASMQPTHCTHYTRADGSDDWSQRLGEDRARRAWCTRDVLDAGAILALGSDYPVAPFDALKIMADAQLRRPVDDAAAAPILPEQGLTAAEALAGYTRGPWAAIGERGGFLAVGEPAAFTVLDVDPLTVAPEVLGDATVLLTVSDGLVTHSA